MGGVGDLPQRSSSPLKRSAEEFDMADTEGTQSDDVDMLTVSEDPTEQNSIRLRGGSVDMLRDEAKAEDDKITIRPSTENILPIDEQIAKVTEIITKNSVTPLREGDKIYLVSKKWLSQVLARGSDVKGSKDIEGAIGPVDNSDIIQEILKDADGADFVRLRPGLGSESFEYFPLEAWDLVVSWYGLAEGSPPIMRIAHNTNQDAYGVDQCQYELYPPVFKLHRVWSEISPIPLPQKMKAAKPEAPILVCSQSEKWRSFLTRAKKELQIELSTKVRIWRIPVILPTEPATEPEFGDREPEIEGIWPTLLVDSPTFTKLEKSVQREELPEAEAGDVSVNPKYNGTRTIAMAGLLSDETLVFEEQIKESPTANGIWLTAYSARDAQRDSPRTSATIVRPTVASKKVSAPTLAGPVTRGRANRNGKTLGVIGLSNMGNTCYMNSALQCVRSVEELTKYFLTEEALAELNRDNPLGNNGEVAMAYGRLLQEIYKKNSTQGSVRPGHFKSIIGKYAPSFSGYGQQDSQEFLGFLLDGLQEDLSRVKKKPYIEKPDSTDEMVDNPELIREMAAKVWDITKKRDDSVIADLFTGMYKSTLVCPVCSKVSITFDPFNNLTLQLPIGDPWVHIVTFFPLNDVAIDIQVDLDKNATIKALKEFVGQRVNVPADRLVVADQWNNKLYKVYDDSENLSEAIQANDKTFVYELDGVPTNWPVLSKTAKKKKFKQTFSYSTNNDDKDPLPDWDDPVADRMLVPIVHRQVNPAQGRFNKPFLACLTPQFITLTRAEASDLNLIKRKVLQKVANLTSSALLHDEDEDENAGSDIVITSGSDADSSGDGKVIARSVDGEDDVVDVTMKDMNGADEEDGKPSTQQDSSFPLKKFRTRQPKFMDPSSYLQPELQNMFQMSYFTENGDMVPTGWSGTSDDKILPKLSERDPQLQAEIRNEQARIKHMNSQLAGENSSQESDDDQTDIGGVTRMADESSDEDTEPGATLPHRPVVSRRPNPIKVGLGLRKNGLKTYSKKGNKFTDRLSRQISEDPDEFTGPLVRLGEGICIDWNYDAYDTLFLGSLSDTFRGRLLLERIEKLPDPALEAKLKARSLRRRNGVTLAECLDEFEREEILSEMDTWYCPRCKEHQRASKKFELWKTPDILIIHLKRFSSSSSRREKLDIPVNFPVENLDISSRVIETEPGKQEIYDLFAVDDHYGGMGGGHYTAFAKSFFDNQWYEYNDTSTSKVPDPNKVVSPAAYLLFYRRRSDVPLGGPKLREICARYDNPVDELEASSANESGEDQRLAGNSSQPGSSSALTGVGAVHHRDGSLPGPGMQTTVDPAMTQGPPAYQEVLEGEEVNGGVNFDEGIVMDDPVGPQPLFSVWNFNKLDDAKNSSNGDAMSERSDIVAHGSEVGEEGMAERLSEFNTTGTDDDYIMDKEIPPPDIDMDDDADRKFAFDVLQEKLHVVDNIEAHDEDENDEKVDEIHV